MNCDHSLQLALGHLLEHDLALRIRVDGDVVQGVQLARAVEHVLVHLTIVPAETGIQHPILKAPAVDQPQSMRSDLLEKRHDGVGSGEHDLMLGAGAAGVELGALLLERVQRMQAEQRPHDGDGFLVELVGVFRVLERRVEVLHHEVLAVGLGEAVEVDEEVVPVAVS